MIQVNNLSKHFGAQILFEDASFNISKGERVGLVGRNGMGKSTLFRMILAQESADEGEISIPKGYRIGYLEQHIAFTKTSVLEECCLALAEDEKYDHYKAESILMGLGFSKEDMGKDPGSFSGGYQVRINLAKALLGNPNMLLLDEPTNYLDIVSIIWLKNFLRSFSGEVMIITHDREFMDDVVTHVMGISRKRVKKIRGNTEKYYTQLSQEDEIYEQTRQNFEKRKKEMQNFVDRFRAKARKASQAQSRLKQLEKMGDMEELSSDKDMGFTFHYKDIPAKWIMHVEDLAFSYSGKQEDVLFKDLKFSIGKNDRIGIIGKNGKGKSTLLNVMAGELKPIRGNVTSHNGLAIGHFGQTNINRLHLKNTVQQEIQAENADLSYTEVRSICGAMIFEGDLADKKIEVLSGGERSRVMLGKILAHKTNLLLLDEPTNHLDMESIEILKDEINNYEGACAVVTHSEGFLRDVVNKLIIFREGGAEFFEGSYDDFLRRVGWESEDETLEDDFIEVKEVPKEKISRKEYKQRRQEIIQERSRVLGPLKKEMDTIEEEIFQGEEEIDALNVEMLKASEAADGKLITEISQKIGKIQIHLADKYDRLDELHNQHDPKAKEFERQLNELEEMI
ncbi:MAG: ABC-F family ATP-binding cassette domain-containing protein [Deltaproteobacteria bacterium]|nr:MAG: ABC-F family ATP-binding cassette domain-containing protein [Deltaproteobacteria bacterium]